MLRATSRGCVSPTQATVSSSRFGLVEADAAEVDAEILLEAAQHDFEHLAQLPGARRWHAWCGRAAACARAALRAVLALTKSSMSVFEPNHLRMRPAGSRSGTARVLNQRYTPSKRRMRKLMSKASPLPTTRAHSICTLTRSSGCTCSSQPRAELLRFAAAGVVEPLPRLGSRSIRRAGRSRSSAAAIRSAS